MSNIAADHERLVKENIFYFLRSESVPLPYFVAVGIIPVEPDTVLQRIRSGH